MNHGLYFSSDLSPRAEREMTRIHSLYISPTSACSYSKVLEKKIKLLEQELQELTNPYMQKWI